MRSSIMPLFAGLLMLGGGTLHAQQAEAPPAGPSVLNQPEVRNPAVRLQANQQGARQRAAQRQIFPPFTNRNDRDPREDAALDQQNQQQQPNNQGETTDENQLLYGGGSSGYSIGGAATIEQARGLAAGELIRSMGEFNRNTAAASMLQEQARDRAISNRHQQVQNYFDVRELNRQERNESRGPAPTPEDLARYNQSRIPARLPATALDQHNGAIHWPAALMAPEFDEHRALLEQVFQGRSYKNSGMDSPSYLEIKEESERMLTTLQERVRQMDPSAYVQAKNFVVSLGYEGRFEAGNASVALGK